MMTITVVITYLIIGLFVARANHFTRPKFVPHKGRLPYSYPNGTPFERWGKNVWVGFFVFILWPLILIIKLAIKPAAVWFFTNPSDRADRKRQAAEVDRAKATGAAYRLALDLYSHAQGDRDLIRLAKLQLEFARSIDASYVPVKTSDAYLISQLTMEAV